MRDSMRYAVPASHIALIPKSWGYNGRSNQPSAEIPLQVKRFLYAGAFALAAAAASPAAVAAPCGGFTDVDDSNPGQAPFCANVEWLKNRSITLGCTSTTLYCPTDNVTRLSMAAFMNRLGTALTPVFLRKRTDNAGQNFSGVRTLCITDPVAPSLTGYLVSGFPRTAIVTGLLNPFTLDVGGMDLQAKLVFSTDDGATWQPSPANDGFAYGSLYATFTPPGDISLRPHTFFDLQVGQSYRFAIQGVRTTAQGGGAVANAYCELHVQIISRNGASTPFDEVPVESTGRTGY